MNSAFFDPDKIKIYLLSALAAVVALTVHEFCHGYAAYKMGDNTAKNLGRLTFNPIKHLDPIGAICMVIFHIGWAKPVPVNPRNFNNPKKGFAITALAGPLVNILLGFLSCGIYLLIVKLFGNTPIESEFTLNLLTNVLLFVYLFYTINVGLGIFNLLPIPPFDGSRIMHAVLPPKLYFGIMRYERRIYLCVLVWLLAGGTVAAFLRSISLIASNPILYSIVGIFDLSGMLSFVIELVAKLMLSFWQLIPFLRV